MSAVYEAQGCGGVYLVELTDDGFRIRHGVHGDFGGGVWSSRPMCRRAAEFLAAGKTIPPGLLPNRSLYA